MSTDEPVAEPDADPATEVGERPGWWHRGHPTFAALTGFYAGLVFAIVVPGLYAAILTALVGQQRVAGLFPFVLVALAGPLLLLFTSRTRRFACYMWLGMISTALVVIGVGGGVFWYMVAHG